MSAVMQGGSLSPQRRAWPDFGPFARRRPQFAACLATPPDLEEGGGITVHHKLARMATMVRGGWQRHGGGWLSVEGRAAAAPQPGQRAIELRTPPLALGGAPACFVVAGSSCAARPSHCSIIPWSAHLNCQARMQHQTAPLVQQHPPAPQVAAPMPALAQQAQAAQQAAGPDDRLGAPAAKLASARRRGGAGGLPISLPDSSTGGGGGQGYSRSSSEVTRSDGQQGGSWPETPEGSTATPSTPEQRSQAAAAGAAPAAAAPVAQGLGLGGPRSVGGPLLSGCGDVVGALVGLGALFMCGFSGIGGSEQVAAMRRRVQALMRVRSVGVSASASKRPSAATGWEPDAPGPPPQRPL